MKHQYTVPTVPQKLSNLENTAQLINIIEHACNVFDYIFSAIEERIDRNNARVHEISCRLARTELKIQKLHGSMSAIKVSCNTKYPCPNNTEFAVPPREASVSKLLLPLTKLGIHNRKAFKTEKLFLCHFKRYLERNTKYTLGLGAIPYDTCFANDLVLFSSGKNIYRHFELSNTLELMKRPLNDETTMDSNIEDAPQSIIERNPVTVPKSQFLYTPSRGTISMPSMPQVLPNLAGVVNDVCFMNSMDSSSGAVSSKATKLNNVPEQLPILLNLPPIPKTTTATKIDVVVSNEDEGHVSGAPLEESVPSCTSHADEKSDLIKSPSEHLTLESTTTDIHTKLMESIRKAQGGKMLRHTDNCPPRHANTCDKNTKMDLMADLHSQLMMRRKGLLGAQKHGTDITGVMARLSTLIASNQSDSDVADANSIVEDDQEWDE